MPSIAEIRRFFARRYSESVGFALPGDVSLTLNMTLFLICHPEALPKDLPEG